MKRAAVIGSIVMAVAVIVGAFIIGGGDGATEAKSGVTTTTVNPALTGANAINSGKNDSKSQSGGPTTSEKKDDDKGEDKECKAPAKNKYETKSAFLGLDPATVRSDKKVEFEVKNFRPCAFVTLSYVSNSSTIIVATVQTDKKGKAEGKFAAPALPTGQSSATFDITASDGGLSDTTTLTVVKKK